MGYPFELEDQVHRRLARGDLEGASLASVRLGEKLRSDSGIAGDLLGPLLHGCLWRIRRSLSDLFDEVPDLPAPDELDRAFADREGGPVVDRYERLVEAMIEGTMDADARAASPAHRARGFVDESFTRPISTASVAHAVACSEAHLCVLFRQAFGITIGDYIRWRRVERAKVLLAATRLPVKAVGHESGYVTYRTFLRNFRAMTGMSPGRYRRLARQSGSTDRGGGSGGPFTPPIPGLA